jgi:hypothetical protein
MRDDPTKRTRSRLVSATGILDPSAAVVYRSDVISPGDLGRDPTFGTFCGYVSDVSGYNIPETDEFFHATTFHEIFEATD